MAQYPAPGQAHLKEGVGLVSQPDKEKPKMAGPVSSRTSCSARASRTKSAQTLCQAPARSPSRAKSGCPTGRTIPCATAIIAASGIHAQGQYPARHHQATGGDAEITTRFAMKAAGGRHRHHHRTMTDNRNRTSADVRALSEIWWCEGRDRLKVQLHVRSLRSHHLSPAKQRGCDAGGGAGGRRPMNASPPRRP